MSNKTEIYYKFIFPTYDSLSTKTGNQAVTSDGLDQIGEVKALCNACPSRVITYDQLTATNPKSMYANGTNGWSTDKKTAIKNYIEYWLSLPKYFNLRNYWDASPCQEGGMSLIVSHTPENLGNSWTKFTVGSNIIYCSLVISSGDFFYGFNLPDEVLTKSGLLDKITEEKFHTNWFITDYDVSLRRALPRAIHFNNSDIVYLENNSASASYIKDPNYPDYPYTNIFNLKSPLSENPKENHEKRAFVQHYFNDHYQYGLQSESVEVSTAEEFHEDLKKDFLGLEATRRILYYYNDEYLENPDNSLVKIKETADIPILIEKVEYPPLSEFQQGYLWWSDTESDTNTEPIKLNTYDEVNNKWVEKTFYTRPALAQNHCENLRKYSKKITTVLSKNIGELGTNTRISYEPPDVYLTDKGGCPPLQIPYNLLRYCLNDRPPFSDCETVLVMWVANGDPNNVADGNVAALHALDWQQYAIPISCRCCFKDTDASNTNRFLVLYPHGETNQAKDEYAFHFRRSAKYKKDLFREALFLQDLIRYSNDYIISYRNITYSNYDTFDIQRYLFSKKSTAFKELYVRKAYDSAANNRENQFYYVKVNKNYYDINTTNTSLKTCFVNPGTTTQFKPSDVLTSDKYKDWDLDSNDWVIRDDWFIALFDKNGFNTSSGTLTLVGANDLKAKLNDIASDDNSWNDIYLSSFGISPYNQTNKDFMKLAGSNRGSMIMLPLDVLDGHIQIGSTTYGSNTANRLVIIGFKDVFDYTNDDYHHLHYNSATNSYVLTKNQNNLYTAYVMSST